MLSLLNFILTILLFILDQVYTDMLRTSIHHFNSWYIIILFLLFMISICLKEVFFLLRINKLLSNYGYCSRKDARILINDSRLTINGLLATQGQWVEETDCIELDSKPLLKKEPLYYIYHKPRGVLSTMDKDKENSLFHTLHLEDYIFPVGRLDQDSEGLLLLTNDGDLAQSILSPTFNHEKEYVVTVERYITQDFIQKMSQGVDIKIGVTKSCQVTKISNDEFKIVLTQGLNRQIRRMSKALGYNVIKLIRLRIMTLQLENLPVGAYRPLTKNQVNDLKKSLLTP